MVGLNKKEREKHKSNGGEEENEKKKDQVKTAFKCTGISREDAGVGGGRAESRDHIGKQSDAQMKNFRWNSPTNLLLDSITPELQSNI